MGFYSAGAEGRTSNQEAMCICPVNQAQILLPGRSKSLPEVVGVTGKNNETGRLTR